ncbi:MAG: hypothetical protein KHZ99_14660 [Clostridium sp.]|uniref:hypothetical protein n=1 Tax=Clostridium TaxID=1485 RepID=UPI0025C24C47|nr:hypothetical protein [Clostridium sp.]MBS4958271.1 hypothetical protein [Clostridium sp.]MDU2155359.1 hypothetical protein [Clostridium sp.]
MRNIIKVKVLYIKVKTKLIKLLPEKYRYKIIKSIVKDISEVIKFFKGEYKRLDINIK